MAEIAQAIRAGSTWTYLLLGLAAAGTLWTVVQTYLETRGRRLSPVFWWIVPAGVATVGFLGTGSGLAQALEALVGASADNRVHLLVRGFILAQHTTGLAALVNAGLGILVALAIACSEYYRTRKTAERQNQWAGRIAAATLLATLVVGIALFGLASHTAAGYPLLASILLGGAACAYVSWELPVVSEDAGPAASDRWNAAVALLVSTTASATALLVLPAISGIRAMSLAAPENRQDVWARTVETFHASAWIGGLAVAGALLIGGLTIASAGEDATRRRAVTELVFVLLTWLPAAAAFAYAASMSPSFLDALQSEPYASVASESKAESAP